jgi:putative selenate reductase
MELIRKTGAKFRLGMDCLGGSTLTDGNPAAFCPEADDPGGNGLNNLKSQGFKYIFLAVGAWRSNELRLDPCDRKPVNVLEFLEAYNKSCDRPEFGQKNRPSGQILKLGKTVVIVGAGNSAMDAARAAKRLQGVEKVYIVYRRTREYMPADKEELTLALKEGVEFKELLSPVAYVNGILKCQKMILGAPDSSGRRSPLAVDGEFVDIEADSIIAAVGEQVETDILVQNGIELDSKGRVAVDPETNETSLAGVYIGGDALRGPATIVEGIADGRRFADIILKKENAFVID